MKRPLIYVRQITNLSDARYCAGMGVDLLGFAVNPGHENFVSPQQYQEMSGWFAGPRRVAEITSLDGIDLSEVIRQYAPDFLHLRIDGAIQGTLHTVPLLIETSIAEMPDVLQKTAGHGLQVSFLLINDLPLAFDKVDVRSDKMKVIVSLDNYPDADIELLMRRGADGFSLKGSQEQSPGLKDYDHLARVLEKLDEHS